MEDGVVKEYDSVPRLMGRTESTFRRMVTSAGGWGGLRASLCWFSGRRLGCENAGVFPFCTCLPACLPRHCMCHNRNPGNTMHCTVALPLLSYS